jgi:hypothetical protein
VHPSGASARLGVTRPSTRIAKAVAATIGNLRNRQTALNPKAVTTRMFRTFRVNRTGATVLALCNECSVVAKPSSCREQCSLRATGPAVLLRIVDHRRL